MKKKNKQSFYSFVYIYIMNRTTDTMKTVPILLLLCLSTLSFCTTKSGEPKESVSLEQDTLVAGTAPEPETEAVPPPIEIVIEKELLYDQHTLADTYPYKDTTREFQWDKIRAGLRLLDSIQQKPARYAIFQNYRNKNGEAPLVRNFHRDAYKRVSDTLGIERYQSVPLYLPGTAGGRGDRQRKGEDERRRR